MALDHDMGTLKGAVLTRHKLELGWSSGLRVSNGERP